MRKTVLLLASMAAALVLASVMGLIPAERHARAAFPGENSKIAFVRGTEAAEPTGEIYIMGADGSGQTRLTNNTVFDGLPAFSPSGKQVAFTSRRDSIELQINDEIYVMDIVDLDGDGNGEGLTRITTSQTVNEFQSAFSPSGEKMTFVNNQAGNNEVYLMDADGTDQVRLTNNVANDARPAFSPLGDRIAFTSNRDGDNEIYVMDAEDRDGDGNGDNLTKITDNRGFDNFVNFSPDGKDLVFTSRRDRNDDIYRVDKDGIGMPTRLTNDPAVDEFPAFSPDGSKLLFSSNRDGNFEIFVMSSDGTGIPTRLTFNSEPDTKPDWGPFLYDFSGFYEPVNNLPTTNVVKAGSAVPVKFGLGGDQGLGILAVGYPKSQQINCDTTAPIDAIEETLTAGDSGLSYDAATDHYTYTWKTNKAWGDTCRQLLMKLDDTTVHQAAFEFR
jgi:Tol biopolymer transport system component